MSKVRKTGKAAGRMVTGGKNSRSGRFAVLSACLALLLPAGCMIAPYDQAKVESKTEQVQFTGGVPNPDAPVTVEAYDPNGKKWDQIGSATSAALPFDAKGTDMYSWSVWITIPEKYWAHECASTGYAAKVRSKWPLGELISVDEDVADCWNDSADFGEFYWDCRSSQSPVARVYTEDFRDFGQECVERINKLRALEGLGPLQRYKEKECAADADAKTNFQTSPHQSQNGDGQNECGTRSSVNAVLNDCIEQQMYYGEKPCYQQYGSNCFYGTQTPCVCGHYINITDPQYKKVACGLYKTPSGSYHSVQNFYR